MSVTHFSQKSEYRCPAGTHGTPFLSTRSHQTGGLLGTHLTGQRERYFPLTRDFLTLPNPTGSTSVVAGGCDLILPKRTVWKGSKERTADEPDQQSSSQVVESTLAVMSCHRMSLWCDKKRTFFPVRPPPTPNPICSQGKVREIPTEGCSTKHQPRAHQSCRDHQESLGNGHRPEET